MRCVPLQPPLRVWDLWRVDAATQSMTLPTAESNTPTCIWVVSRRTAKCPGCVQVPHEWAENLSAHSPPCVKQGLQVGMAAPAQHPADAARLSPVEVLSLLNNHCLPLLQLGKQGHHLRVHFAPQVLHLWTADRTKQGHCAQALDGRCPAYHPRSAYMQGRSGVHKKHTSQHGVWCRHDIHWGRGEDGVLCVPTF